MKKNYQVFVISKESKPLMPTRRFSKVRKLLKTGEARVVKGKPFTIQLLYETKEHTQPLILGIDPGEEIGCTIRKRDGEIICAGKLETRRQEVSENMEERKMHRGSRRRHRRKKKQRRAKKAKTCFAEKSYKIAKIEKPLVCKWIKPKAIRFHNRHREKGWLTATARHMLESHKNFVQLMRKVAPISSVSVEYGKFDISKLDNPEISGEDYQNGTQKGYTNIHDYVLCRDQHTCQLCQKNAKGVELNVHHVVWKSKGGSNTPENLLTLCTKCHDRVHTKPKVDAKVKELFAGIKKRYVHTTLLNSVMPSFVKWLEAEFGKVVITYGYETKEKRRALALEKDHIVDAYLISFTNTEDIPAVDFNNVVVYQFKQFRRHHRQIIHAVRDRNYKLEKKIVAKNRSKRTGQLTDSLKELVEKEGRQILCRLQILPGKKVKRSNFGAFRKGDVVRYKGRRYVVKGYGEMGRRLGFVGQKQYVLAKDCQLITRNTGIVCL